MPAVCSRSVGRSLTPSPESVPLFELGLSPRVAASLRADEQGAGLASDGGSAGVLETRSASSLAAPASSRDARSDLHAAFYVGAAVTLLYLLIQQGQVTVSDGRDMLAVSQAVVHHGTAAVAPQFGVAGLGGRYFAKYGIGLSLLAVPFVAFADLVSVVVGHQTKLENFFAASLVPVIMGFLAASLFRTTRKLGAGPRWATVTAVGSVFGTYALPYGKDFFAEPLTTLAIVLSIEFLLSGRYAIAGAALTVAVTTRPESAVLVAVLPLIVWVFRGLRDAFTYGAIAAIGVVVDLVYNQSRFGSIFKTGYGSEGFSTPFLHGAAGLLFSPEKSLLLFAPIVVLVGLGSVRLWTSGNRFVVVLALTNFLVFFVLSATWHSWQGGWSWGPRLLLPGVIPTMILMSTLTRKERLVGVGLFIAGFAVSASTILVSTRAQQLDSPLPSVGPSVLRQYEHLPSVTSDTIDHLQNTRPLGDSRTYLSLWQINLKQFGRRGELAAIAGTLVLLAALVVAVRRIPIWQSHSPPVQASG
jgi:hypothetical protein